MRIGYATIKLIAPGHANPLPLGIALAGCVFVFATTQPPILLFGLGVLAVGLAGFPLWSRRAGTWPFARAAT